MDKTPLLVFPAQRKPLIPTNGDIKLETIVLVVSFILTVCVISLPAIRYLSYAIPYFSLLLILVSRQIKIHDSIRPFLFLLISAIPFLPLATSEGAKDLFFILSGISIALTGIKINLSVRALFMIFAVGLATEMLVGSAFSHSFVFDPIHSESSFESSFAFLFGLLGVVCVLEKRWVSFLLCLVMTVITLKRITVLAVILCFLVWLLPERVKKMALHPVVMIGANVLFLAFIIVYVQGDLDWIIREFTGQSANQLGVGRQAILHDVVKDLSKHPLRSIFVGSGPGTAYELVSEGLGLKTKTNLHNDVAKILVDYGGICLAAFLWLLHRPKSLRLRLLAMFSNILFLTDNVLTYHFYLFFYVMFAIRVEPDAISVLRFGAK